MAVMLVENMSAHFDPARYHDDYREAVIQVVESKLTNQPIERPEVQETGKVTDLMAALEGIGRSSQVAPRRGNGCR